LWLFSNFYLNYFDKNNLWTVAKMSQIWNTDILWFWLFLLFLEQKNVQMFSFICKINVYHEYVSKNISLLWKRIIFLAPLFVISTSICLSLFYNFLFLISAFTLFPYHTFIRNKLSLFIHKSIYLFFALSLLWT